MMTDPPAPSAGGKERKYNKFDLKIYDGVIYSIEKW